MTERPEGTPEATPDEATPLTDGAQAPGAAEAPEAPQAETVAPQSVPEAPQAETVTGAPEAAAAVAEEVDAQSGALDSEMADSADDEVDDELAAEEATDEELDEEAAEEAEALAEGADETDELEPDPGVAAAGTAAGASGSAVSRRRGAPAPAVQRAPTQSELAVHVTDNASRFFVIAAVVIFVAILAFGLLAGNGGLLTNTPAPPTAAPSVSAEPSASGSATPSESTEVSASPS